MNVRWLHGQLERGPACEQRLQRANPFDPRELVAEAEMNARPERETDEGARRQTDSDPNARDRIEDRARRAAERASEQLDDHERWRPGACGHPLGAGHCRCDRYSFA